MTMASEPVLPASGTLITITQGGPIVPAIIADAGERAGKRFIEFFTATIRNANTRRAYARAVWDFLAWCETQHCSLLAIEPLHVASYIEQLTRTKAAPTVKQHLAAISMLLDWLTSGGILPFNPAASVRGPKHVVKRGKTPVLTAGEARQLLDSIPLKIGLQPPEGEEDTRPPDLIGLRDRALIAVMVYSFARVGAALVWRQLEFPVDDHYFSRTYQPVVIRSPVESGGPSWPAPRGSSARSTPRSRSDEPAGRSPPPSSSRP